MFRLQEYLITETLGRWAVKFGWAGEVFSIGQAGFKFAKKTTPGNLGRFSASIYIAALNAVPAVGTTGSFILTGINNDAGFEPLYNYLDKSKTWIFPAVPLAPIFPFFIPFYYQE